jgi:hypothetical protein
VAVDGVEFDDEPDSKRSRAVGAREYRAAGTRGPDRAGAGGRQGLHHGRVPLAFDSNAKIARNLLGFRQDGMDVDYVQERNSHFEAVTLEDVKRVASEYMKPEAFTFVLVGEPRID